MQGPRKTKVAITHTIWSMQKITKERIYASGILTQEQEVELKEKTEFKNRTNLAETEKQRRSVCEQHKN